MVHLFLGMHRAGCKADALRTTWNCRIVNRLHIDREAIEESIRQGLALHRIADKHRHDMTRCVHHRQVLKRQSFFQHGSAELVLFALHLARFEVTDARERAGA